MTLLINICHKISAKVYYEVNYFVRHESRRQKKTNRKSADA